jgi:hypothetical protein
MYWKRLDDGDAEAGAVEQQLPPLWLVALTLEQWSSSCRPSQARRFRDMREAGDEHLCK